MIKRIIHGFDRIELSLVNVMYEHYDLYMLVRRQLNNEQLKRFINDVTYLHEVYRDFE